MKHTMIVAARGPRTIFIKYRAGKHIEEYSGLEGGRELWTTLLCSLCSGDTQLNF